MDDVKYIWKCSNNHMHLATLFISHKLRFIYIVQKFIH